ncbi:MAG: hypothetical protein WCT16_03195 [Candidatus Buchananbacteria bacterium]
MEKFESRQESKADEAMRVVVGSENGYIQPETLASYVKSLPEDIKTELKPKILDVLRKLAEEIESA